MTPSAPWTGTSRRPSTVASGVLAGATATLAPAEIVSNAAVMMFGGIETSEGMTTSLFWHLLTNPAQLAAVRADRSLLANAVEESLRLEPAAARVDRYATADVELAGASIEQGDLVIVSLTAANRDPATFPDPDAFDVSRPNATAHRRVRPGSACLRRHPSGEARDAVGRSMPPSTAGPTWSSSPGRRRPRGVIFRKPRSLPVRWTT